MAEWILERSPKTILEPSFGDGGFLRAIAEEATKRAMSTRLIGAEIDPAAFARTQLDLPGMVEGHEGDFLAVRPQPVDAAIGNPPFVRLRHLDPENRASALAASAAALGRPMELSGSTWMAFVLHATQFLTPGGCLALVVPLEITHVRYARPLWAFLGSEFGRVKLIRTYDRLFPDLLQDVAVLLCERRGEMTTEVEFQASTELIALDEPKTTTTLPLGEVHDGERAFTAALLPPEIRRLMSAKLVPATKPLGRLATVRIGYVAGDKHYFHPDGLTVKTYGLPDRSLVPTATQTRALRGAGLFTSAARQHIAQNLWRPDPNNLTSGESRYIAAGEGAGVSQRYKCAVRSPWFVVPGVIAPDVICSVFSNEPLLMVNDGGLAASNSLLTAFMSDGESALDLAAGWFTSVAQLFVELEVHSLGGGVLIAVPNELAKVRIPAFAATKAHLREIDGLLREGDVEGARALGDQALIEMGTITQRDLEMIRRAIRLLRDWRERPDRDH